MHEHDEDEPRCESCGAPVAWHNGVASELCSACERDR